GPNSKDGKATGGAQLIVTEYACGSRPESTPTCPGTPTETNSRAPRRKRNSRVAAPIVASGQSRLRTWTMPRPSTQQTPAVQPKDFGQRKWLNSYAQFRTVMVPSDTPSASAHDAISPRKRPPDLW